MSFRSGNFKDISAGDMSGSITGGWIDIQSFRGFSVQAVWSGGGTPVGTLKIQASNDDGTNAEDIAGLSYSVTTDGSVLFEAPFAPYAKIRTVYTRSSGSGTINTHFCGKE